MNRSNWFARHPLLAYFSLAFVFTWLFFGPISLGQNGLGLLPLPYNLSDGVVFLFYMLATFGPLSAALIVTRMSGGRFSDVLRRVIQWRVNFVWYLITIFSSLVIWLIVYAIPLAGLPFMLVTNNIGMVTGLFVANLLVGLLLPSLGEEPSWRGFALPRLQEHICSCRYSSSSKSNSGLTASGRLLAITSSNQADMYPINSGGIIRLQYIRQQ